MGSYKITLNCATRPLPLYRKRKETLEVDFKIRFKLNCIYELVKKEENKEFHQSVDQEILV